MDGSIKDKKKCLKNERMESECAFFSSKFTFQHQHVTYSLQYFLFHLKIFPGAILPNLSCHHKDTKHAPAYAMRG